MERRDDVLRELHFRQRVQEGERGFRALVLVHTIHMQRVAAAAGGRRVEFQSQIVPAEKPVEDTLGVVIPPKIGRAHV